MCEDEACRFLLGGGGGRYGSSSRKCLEDVDTVSRRACGCESSAAERAGGGERPSSSAGGPIRGLITVELLGRAGGSGTGSVADDRTLEDATAGDRAGRGGSTSVPLPGKAGTNEPRTELCVGASDGSDCFRTGRAGGTMLSPAPTARPGACLAGAEREGAARGRARPAVSLADPSAGAIPLLCRGGGRGARFVGCRRETAATGRGALTVGGDREICVCSNFGGPRGSITVTGADATL